MRQVLANSFQEYQPLAGQAYKSGDLETFRTLSSRMLDIIKAQDKLLSSSDDFLVGAWIDDARTMLDGADDWTADLFELNARALVTTWGLNKNGSLIDYSNRQWAGLTGDYYYRRWKTYVDNRLNKLEHGTDFTDPDWFDYGWQWANRKSDEDGYGFATEAADDVDQKALGKIILDQYSVTAMDDVTDGGTAVERTNLALGHDVTDEDTGTVVPDVTDGNTDTGWTQTGKTDATLVVDLDGTYSITGAGITLQQIAADFPLRYEIEVWNGSGWVEIGRSEADAVSSKNEVAADILGSKVRWKLHSTNGRDLTGIYELSVWGAAQPQPEYTNLALGGAAAPAPASGPRRTATTATTVRCGSATGPTRTGIGSTWHRRSVWTACGSCSRRPAACSSSGSSRGSLTVPSGH